MSDRRELYQRAAECYVGAGLLDDACRCHEAAGDFITAGRLHERLERQGRAARSYELGRAWHDAARCWLDAGRPIDAARCLEQGEALLEAAWIFAERAHRYDRARALAARVRPEGPGEQAAQALVLARCAAGKGDRRHGALLLSQQLQAIAARTAGIDGAGNDGERLFDRALTVAGHLGRPDLISALFTAAHRAGGSPELLRRWEAWSMTQLGAATGIPETSPEAGLAGPTAEPGATAQPAAAETTDSS